MYLIFVSFKQQATGFCWVFLQAMKGFFLKIISPFEELRMPVVSETGKNFLLTPSLEQFNCHFRIFALK